MNTVLGPFFYRDHRITLEKEDLGWCYLVESRGRKRRVGHFNEDHQAHYAATQMIDRRTAVKGFFEVRLPECKAPPGPEHFGQRLRWAIRAAGLKPINVSTKSGISERQLCAWMKAEIPPPELATMVRLSDFLNCRAVWLQSGEGSPWAVLPYPARKRKAVQR